MSLGRASRRSGLVRGALLAHALASASSCTPREAGRGAPDGGTTETVGEGGGAEASDGGVVDVPAALAELAAAEDARSAARIAPAWLVAEDARVRRRAARALARIGGDAAAEALGPRLADEDLETVTWSAYGLGFACKGREEATVKRLVARLATFEGSDAPSAGAPARAPEVGDRASARTAIVRAIGRCGGAPALRALDGLARAGEALREPVALAYGDVALRAKKLDAEPATRVVELLEGGASVPPVPTALYPLARAEIPEPLRARALEAVRRVLPGAGDARVLAVRALARLGREPAAPELGALARDAAGDVGVRAEAARQLGTLGVRGKEEAAASLAALVGEGAPVAGPATRATLAVLGALVTTCAPEPGAEVGPKARAALAKVARLGAGASLDAATRARFSAVRCAAAGPASPGEPEHELVRACGLDGEGDADVRAEARLVALLARPVDTSARRAAFRELAERGPLRVRELAVEALRGQRELARLAPPVLASALDDAHAGLVATAAEVLHARPDLVLEPTPAERRKGLDPRAPAPDGRAAQALVPEVARALDGALARAWPEDRFETRLALVEAATSTGHPRAAEVVDAAACDANVTVRERARKAQRTLGRAPTCATERAPEPAPELDGAARAARIVLVTDAGELRLLLAPELAPVTTARLLALARARFYVGVRVHRVVPGFVLQLGDPDGDGYGGSGRSLRCETSPVPFERGDVGMALAGRDTGSSQLYVTLARTPHLDGDYAWVGRAEGPLDAVLQGDVIRDVRVED